MGCLHARHDLTSHMPETIPLISIWPKLIQHSPLRLHYHRKTFLANGRLHCTRLCGATSGVIWQNFDKPPWHRQAWQWTIVLWLISLGRVDIPVCLPSALKLCAVACGENESILCINVRQGWTKSGNHSVAFDAIACCVDDQAPWRDGSFLRVISTSHWYDCPWSSIIWKGVKTLAIVHCSRQPQRPLHTRNIGKRGRCPRSRILWTWRHLSDCDSNLNTLIPKCLTYRCWC